MVQDLRAKKRFKPVPMETRKEKLKKIGKDLFYLYQRGFWYIGQAKGEILKPLGFWNETILILTFLAVNGQRPSWKIIGAAYIVVLLTMAAFGKVIVAIGIVKYNTHIANKENKEIMEIKQGIEDIKKLIGEQKHG